MDIRQTINMIVVLTKDYEVVFTSFL